MVDGVQSTPSDSIKVQKKEVKTQQSGWTPYTGIPQVFGADMTGVAYMQMLPGMFDGGSVYQSNGNFMDIQRDAAAYTATTAPFMMCLPEYAQTSVVPQYAGGMWQHFYDMLLGKFANQMNTPGSVPTNRNVPNNIDPITTEDAENVATSVTSKENEDLKTQIAELKVLIEKGNSTKIAELEAKIVALEAKGSKKDEKIVPEQVAAVIPYKKVVNHSQIQEAADKVLPTNFSFFSFNKLGLNGMQIKNVLSDTSFNIDLRKELLDIVERQGKDTKPKDYVTLARPEDAEKADKKRTDEIMKLYDAQKAKKNAEAAKAQAAAKKKAQQSGPNLYIGSRQPIV